MTSATVWLITPSWFGIFGRSYWHQHLNFKLFGTTKYLFPWVATAIFVVTQVIFIKKKLHAAIHKFYVYELTIWFYNDYFCNIPHFLSTVWEQHWPKKWIWWNASIWATRFNFYIFPVILVVSYSRMMTTQLKSDVPTKWKLQILNLSSRFCREMTVILS